MSPQERTELRSGWWRCDCDIPCNCGRGDKFVKKLHAPGDTACLDCGVGMTTEIWDGLDPEGNRARILRERGRVG